MAQGFLAGAILGTVVSGVGIGALSIVVGPPEPASDLVAEAPVVAVATPPQPVVSETPPVSLPKDSPQVQKMPAAPEGKVPQVKPQNRDLKPDPQIAVAAPTLPSQPQPDVDPVVSTEPAAQPVQPQAEPAPPKEEPRVRTALVAPQADAGRPKIGKPAGSILDKSAVPEGRLPSIGTVPVTEAEPDTGPQTPLYLNAATTQDGIAADLPKMAVILIDQGGGPLGPDALGEIPFPVSFALATSHPNATAAARSYRAQGFEVVALVDVPQGAAPSDVEVSFSSTLETVPDVVALLEAPDSGLQDDRQVVAQATSYLSKTGHGLVTQSKGLNTAQKLAVKEGVPAVTVFRDLDGEGQDSGMIRRSLENAAFRARQEGAVVMMGRLNGDTLSSLFLWGMQDRSDKIAMVPVSHLLQQSIQP